MRRVSQKREKLIRENREWRKSLVESIGRCQICGSTSGLAVHEIARGPARQKAFSERAACMVVCNLCNSGCLDDYSEWPIERQIALQCISLTDRQPQEIIDTINTCRGRAKSAITWGDVCNWLTLANPGEYYGRPQWQ